MNKTMETKRSKDKRRLLLLIPVLVIPFLILGFYKLDGGKAADTPAYGAGGGINTSLPDASFKAGEPLSKIGYYALADQDSVSNGAGPFEQVKRGQEQAQTQAIQDRLAELDKEISRPAEPVSAVKGNKAAPAASMKGEVDRLEVLMQTMQQNKSEDPEMSQLNSLMQNILDIQHPERVASRIAKQPLLVDSQFRATPAVIAEGGRVVQGATVKLILQDSMRISGVLIPKGHSVFGACRIINQRLLLDIRQLRLGTSIIPVDLSVYSLDGMAGIAAPEAVLAEAVSSGADNAVRDIGMLGIDQSIGVQVAGAGIDAAKNLLSKRLRRIKVKLQAGSTVLLRNNQAKQR